MGSRQQAQGLCQIDFCRQLFAQAKLVLKATDVHPLGYPTVEAVERIAVKSFGAVTAIRRLDPIA